MAGLALLISERQPNAIDKAGWRAIGDSERAGGRVHAKLRRKLTRADDLLAASRGALQQGDDSSST